MIALRMATSRKKPRIPAGVRIYAVGDIHGRVDLLDQVLKRIDADLAANPASIGIEVYLGDYIDRGPASREVIDRLVARNRTFRAVFLKGNHETYLTSFATNPPILEDWRLWGASRHLSPMGLRHRSMRARMFKRNSQLSLIKLCPPAIADFSAICDHHLLAETSFLSMLAYDQAFH